MASAAEARMREKAERLLREHFPGARIVHEFELGGVRLDIAAITPDRLALLEIKSERDTLTRLEKQARWALHVGGPVLVCYAPRWAEQIKALRQANTDLYQAHWLEEADEGFTVTYPLWLRPENDRYNNRTLFSLLLKPELLAMARPFGGKSKHTVPELHHLAHEGLTGREIRRAVMAALRARRFGWTCDEPVHPREAA